jgi:hypothetical protein
VLLSPVRGSVPPETVVPEPVPEPVAVVPFAAGSALSPRGPVVPADPVSVAPADPVPVPPCVVVVVTCGTGVVVGVVTDVVVVAGAAGVTAPDGCEGSESPPSPVATTVKV